MLILLVDFACSIECDFHESFFKIVFDDQEYETIHSKDIDRTRNRNTSPEVIGRYELPAINPAFQQYIPNLLDNQTSNLITLIHSVISILSLV